MQQHLFVSESKQVSFMAAVQISRIEISPYNPRQTWDMAHVERLAGLIGVNGYDSTYAVKCYEEAGKLYCFAGSNRIKAMQRIGREAIPVFLYEGCTPEQIWRMAYEDNEQADAQQQFSMVDVWLDYKAKADAGWTQQKIADVLGVSQPTVKYRLMYAQFGDEVLFKISTTPFVKEAHFREILELVQSTNFTRSTLLCEIIDNILARTKEPTSKQFKAEVEKYNAVIAAAEKWAGQLEGEYLGAFLADIQTLRSAALIEAAGRKRQEAQAEARDAHVRTLQQELEAAEDEQRRTEREVERGRKIQAVLDRIRLGDSRALAAEIPEGTNVIFTDPPYGADFQSNRRTKSEKAMKIANDGSQSDAIQVFFDTIKAAYPRLAPDAALFAWCDWQSEPAFREAIAAAGFEVKNSVIWVKNNHGTGDLEGAFAPKHERLLFAVKGRPLFHHRLPDVLHGGEFLETEHPTPKPVDLIEKIIEAITVEGDIIADPFMGSCPTGVAAIRSGRKFWGCDIEHKWWQEAQDNIAKIIAE